MAILPQVLLLVLHTHPVLDTRRRAQSTPGHRPNTCRGRMKGIESSRSMLRMIAIKSMGGKVLRTRSRHGPKLHGHTQAILLPCQSMTRTATGDPCTRCLIRKSRVRCTHHLLCIEPTPLRHNTLKHPIHRIIIILRQVKTTRNPLLKQLQHTPTLYVHLLHVATINTRSVRRC